MAIFVMLNNFLHDFAVAVLFACLLVMSSIYRNARNNPTKAGMDFLHHMYQQLNKAIMTSWVAIIAGGIIRTLAYERYEWVEAAGRGQIAALIIKHALLVSFVVAGTILQLR